MTDAELKARLKRVIESCESLALDDATDRARLLKALMKELSNQP